MENGLCPDRNELVDYATRDIEGYRPIAHISDNRHKQIDNHISDCHTCSMAAENYREQFLRIKLILGVRRQYEVITIDQISDRYVNAMRLPY